MSACVSGCTIRGEHLAECDGTALGRDSETVECRGCLPRPAEVGDAYAHAARIAREEGSD